MTAYRHTTALAMLGFLLASTETVAAEEATAHRPQYDNRNLWPHDVEKTDYFKQTWPAAPLMVWAKTDTRYATVDPRDPSNWLIDGQPATRLPNRDTDIVIPAGRYTIRSDDRTTFQVRHATVGDGVRFNLHFQARGNVWIKAGASVNHAGSWNGPGDVFVRNDNTDFSDSKTHLANKIVVAKAADASVEIIGTARTGDEFAIQSGTFIVGPDSTFCPGDRSIQYVFPGARLVLMSGAAFHKRNNQHGATDLVIGGELAIGTPERPITRDCTIALSRKSKGAFKEATKKGDRNDYGMLIEPGGKFNIHSADPRTARLVITHHNLPDGSWGLPNKLADSLPRRTDVVLQGDLHLDGILFDSILKGGIMMKDPSIMKKWTVFYGEHNEVAGDALYTRLADPTETKVKVDAGTAVRDALNEIKQN